MKPTSEAELADLISSVKAPLCIRGGGTRLLGPIEGEVLETSGLQGISLYEPGALTMVAGAGTTLDEIGAALKAENQRLAFEPPDLRDVLGTTGASTIGGVAASNAMHQARGVFLLVRVVISCLACALWMALALSQRTAGA